MDRLDGAREVVRHVWGHSEGVDPGEMMRNVDECNDDGEQPPLCYCYLCIAKDAA